MLSRHSLLLFLVLLLSVFAIGCGEKQEAKAVTHQMGEPAQIGNLTYMVVESSWRSQLGEGFQTRAPQNRFLVLTLSITNRGSSEASIPMLNMESSTGQKYQEISEGAGIVDWLGIIRKVGPGQTIQGRVAFDVPLSVYRIQLPESGETGYDKFTQVEIPMRIDSDQVQPPLPSNLPSDSK